MQTERRLTSFSHGAGCGCKLGPSDLTAVLGSLSMPELTDEVLVAADTSDDAAVVRLPDGHALIATLDFFTPIVDDLPLELLGQVLQGGIDVASKAGAAVLGGHSITDPEPKYGMVALGLVDPERIVRNSTAPAGARLFLTKPLGVGIVTTAVKRGVADDALLARAVDLMTTLNADASIAMREAGADSATDVTGFGLLGHLHRMLLASGVSATLDANAIPVLEGVLELAERDVVPGGSQRNRAYVSPKVDWGQLAPPERLVLADAQTSGGLLIAAADGSALERELDARAVPFAEIGRVEAGEPGRIAVTGRLARA